MRKTIGILAHVDAGKTTLSEQLLYLSGAIRTAGRVDHQSSFLDMSPVERERGITVFSDQAIFELGKNRYYWLDTPGHSDFSSEMERALEILDYALLVVSCVDGVQSHTETIWQLLRARKILTLIFVNKCDRPEADFDACLKSMRTLLSQEIADFRGFDGENMNEYTREALAERDEEMLDLLVAGEEDPRLWHEGLIHALRDGRIFPVFCGSALNGSGVAQLLRVMDSITQTDYESRLSQPMAACVYKLRHDSQGGRQLYLKILQGRLRVKEEVETSSGRMKINALYFRHGSRNISTQEAVAGDLVWVPGLQGLKIGDGLGELAEKCVPASSEAMTEVSVHAQGQTSSTQLMQALTSLQEEDPALSLSWDGHAPALRVMGEMQTEIIARLMQERYGISVSFGEPRILYKETIADSAVGIGHYEPLKHYAEVWLRLSPAPRGSGIRFVSRCHVDDLALNWQRLIEKHVFERSHPGVLTGAPLTDVTVELLAGRAHLKHTEGGDFRQSCYRAIQNALMQVQSVLLEPICAFSLRMNAESYGRISADLQRMQAETEPPLVSEGWMLIHGCCPYRHFVRFPETFRALTHGSGSLRMWLSHYAPAANAEEIIAAADYHPKEADSPDSIFCSHGAGHVVPWNEVRAHAHCRVDLSQYDFSISDTGGC